MIAFDPQTLVGCQFIHNGNRSNIYTITKFIQDEAYGYYRISIGNEVFYDRLTDVLFDENEEDFIDDNGYDFLITNIDAMNSIKNKDPLGYWFFIKKPSFDLKFKKHLEVIRNTQ